MTDETGSEPPPLDPERFHEQWKDGAFVLAADRQAWTDSVLGVVIVVCAFITLIVLLSTALWSKDRIAAIFLLTCQPAIVCIAFVHIFVNGRFSRVFIRITRHEVRVRYRPRRMGEKDFNIPRGNIIDFFVTVGGYRGPRDEALVVRTKQDEHGHPWRLIFCTRPCSFSQLAARLNWALAKVDELQTYRD